MLVTSDAAIRDRTGRGWEEWFDLLDAEGMTTRPHREIARHVAALLDVAPLAWSAQAVTKSYERARGGRAVGEKDDGTFTVSVSRTVGVSADDLHATITEDPARWFGEGLRPRPTTAARTARYDYGESRVALFVGARDATRSTVTVEHSRITDAGEAERLRAFWRERLAELRAAVETRQERADA
ncbi:hypothetical protein BU204_30350 [Actinophytocola xanthii]|uniref:DUF4287 domain-containing protein n=1 Tax=Actinophytocola xanthii TaxID=1912961 RepID=A0A1Q8CAJ8_9PSEU|nr:hypothetical protein BU204_30350 [Actinophytocola xanthii]